MRKISFTFSICFLCFLVFSCTSSKKSVLVFDYEHDLTQEQITKLDSLYKSHEKKTTNEIALVTTPDYGTDTSIILFAEHFGNNNGVGKKNKNNGVIIVFCGTKRETRIGTGYGTEKVLNNDIAKKIIDSLMIPNFKQAKTFEGLWEGSKAIVEFLERPENKIN